MKNSTFWTIIGFQRWWYLRTSLEWKPLVRSWRELLPSPPRPTAQQLSPPGDQDVQDGDNFYEQWLRLQILLIVLYFVDRYKTECCPHSESLTPIFPRLQFLSSARLPLGVRLYGGLVWPLTKPRAKNKKTMTSKGNSPRPTEQSVLTLLSFSMAAKQGICQVFQNSFQYISLCARSNSRC